MDRTPSNTPISRLSLEHRENLHDLKKALENLRALPAPLRQKDRNLYVSYITRALDAGWRTVEGLGDGPPSKPGGKW